MKNRIILLASGVCFNTMLMAQATVISNNSTDPHDFLGWDAFTAIPLEIKHDNNRTIRFSTDNTPSWGVRNDGYILGGTANPIQDGLLSVRMGSHPSANYGIFSLSEHTMGGRFSAENANNNVALGGQTTNPAEIINYGSSGAAQCQGQETFNVGVYGNIGENCPGASFAGYFNGKTFCSSGSWSASDENLKSNVNPLTNGQALISALEPKQYNFQQQDNNDLILPAGLQFGLLAQELEAVIPSAVTEIVHSGGLDALKADNEAPTFMGVNYQLLIPVLLANFKEQESSLQEAIAQLTELEDAVQQIENRVAIEKYNITHSE